MKSSKNERTQRNLEGKQEGSRYTQIRLIIKYKQKTKPQKTGSHHSNRLSETGTETEALKSFVGQPQSQKTISI